MKHFGDITQLRGYDLPVVDVITGGSPCQDLSVAGKRAGLDGERSGLFMEQIRLVKEMRTHDKANGRSGYSVRPRYMVWENVPGAFSSNSGRDFQAVLTEIVRIAEPDAPDVPMPEKGKWPHAGCLYDELGEWSVAWRLHDAQYFGVPQRRKRICVLADFNGLTAAEILFDPQLERTTEGGEPVSTVRDSGNEPRPEIPIERECVSGDFEPGRAAWEGTAAGIEGGSDSAICLQGNGIDRADTAGCSGAGWRRGGSYTLNTIDRQAVLSFQEREGKTGVEESLSQLNGAERSQQVQNKVSAFKAGNGAKAYSIGFGQELSPTISATPSQVPSLLCGNPQDSQSERIYLGDGAWHSLGANESGGQSRDALLIPQVARSLTRRMDGSPCQRTEFVVTAVDCRNGTENECINGTLQAKEQGSSLNLNNVVRTAKPLIYDARGNGDGGCLLR